MDISRPNATVNEGEDGNSGVGEYGDESGHLNGDTMKLRIDQINEMAMTELARADLK